MAELTIQSTGQTEGRVSSRVGDCLALVVDDPNGPILGTVGTLVDWDDLAFRIDIGHTVVAIPFNLVRFVHAVDGNVVEPLEFDPNRP